MSMTTAYNIIDDNVSFSALEFINGIYLYQWFIVFDKITICFRIHLFFQKVNLPSIASYHSDIKRIIARSIMWVKAVQP